MPRRERRFPCLDEVRPWGGKPQVGFQGHQTILGIVKVKVGSLAKMQNQTASVWRFHSLTTNKSQINISKLCCLKSIRKRNEPWSYFHGKSQLWSLGRISFIEESRMTMVSLYCEQFLVSILNICLTAYCDKYHSNMFNTCLWNAELLIKHWCVD